MHNEFQGTGNMKLPSLHIEATGDGRVNFGVPHLLTAVIFSRQLREIESTHKGEDFGNFWDEIFAAASGVVFASVASLESYVNELFVDHEIVFQEIRTEIMKKLWELYERKSILEKYELALLIKNAEAFNHGHTLYQDVKAIIKLRNGLVHFKPEWFSKQKEHDKISKTLNGKATLSPFFSKTEPLFPRGWASYGTTKWIIKSVLNFILEFERRTNIKRMEIFKDRFRSL